ncbi:MAG: hypothetical protein ACTSV7_05615 [Candidatus Baldrarchaeia archaeon]
MCSVKIKKLKRIVEGNQLLQDIFDIIHKVFLILLVVFLVSLLVESVWEKLLSAYLDLNKLLIIVIVLGVITILTRREREKVVKVEVTWKDLVYIGVVSFACFVIVWWKIKDLGLGWLTYLIPVVSGFLVFLLSLVILLEEE